MPHTGRHRLGREPGEMLLEPLEAFGVRLDVLPVVELLGHDHVHHGIEQRHVGAVPELQHVGGVALERLAARIHDDQLRAAFGRLLEIGGGDGMVLRRVGADHHDDVGVPDRGERRGDRARADGLHQCRHRGGMAQPGAVVDVVGAEAGAHQLLEQIGLLVGALGRPEPGQRPAAVAVARCP